MMWALVVFKYFEPLWLGSNGKLSINKVLAIAFSIDFISNMSYIVHRWSVGRSYAEVAMLLGLEAALIAALLALKTYANMNMFNKTVDNDDVDTVRSE